MVEGLLQRSSLMEGLRRLRAAPDKKAFLEQLLGEALVLCGGGPAWILEPTGPNSFHLISSAEEKSEHPVVAEVSSCWWGGDHPSPVRYCGSAEELRASLGIELKDLGDGPWWVASLGAAPLPLAGLLVVSPGPGEALDVERQSALEILTHCAAGWLAAFDGERALSGNREHLWSWVDRIEEAGNPLSTVHRLKTLGDLLGGLVHELNNPLAAIQGYLQVLLRCTGESRQASDDLLLKIHEQARRCTHLLARLAEYAQAGQHPAGVLHLNALVDDVFLLKAYSLRKGGVKVVREIPENLMLPELEPGCLQQVLLNLLDNALWALRQQEKPLIRLRAGSREGGLFLIVEDNGCGINRALRGRVFDPFFSTRLDGGQVGLGLTICVELLERAGGCLSVESAEGQGSRFTVWVPL